jgi:signal transduction histidine kinase
MEIASLNFQNLDLLSVGIAVAGMLILGFVTFFNNAKSISSKLFLCLAVVSSAWSIVNYASYQIHSIEISFWLLRFVLFFGALASFFIFTLAYVFPEETAKGSRYYWWIIVPATGVATLLTLTPAVFSGIVSVTGKNITQVSNGPGIFVFGIVVAFLNIGSIVMLVYKAIRKKEQRKPLLIFLAGVVIMLALILIFNFVLPAFFQNTGFTPLGGIFLLPFIILTSYAIIRHGLLSIKVVATEILAFALATGTLFEVVTSGTFVDLVIRTLVFVFILITGILLIRSVLREVKQREELQELNSKLDAANKQLEELSHFKSELLSLASHQIRSPLAAIKGFGTLIVGGSYGPVSDKVKETVGKMGESANSLIGLINTLLDMRKVDEGKMEYQMARTDLKKITIDVVDLLRGLAETKKLEFTFTAPDKEIPVSADAEKLKQIVQNLTDNAIKYTPSGFVHVEIKEEPSTVAGQPPVAIVTVSDSGVGFSPDLAPHLFEEFIRDERVKKQILGTGLGLYIARKITEAHGGKLWAESPGEGKGSAFHLSIPEVQ